MSIPEWCERIQGLWLSRLVSETTWGYPIVGALHVLSITVFGGAVLVPHLCTLGLIRGRNSAQVGGEVRLLQRTGLITVLVTGALLFAGGAVRYYGSAAFRIKMALLAIILLNAIALNAIAAGRGDRSRLHSWISLTFWAAVIFAARGIAFF
jgi:hypothetical protein